MNSIAGMRRVFKRSLWLGKELNDCEWLLQFIKENNAIANAIN
jgi:hypothetical protein